MSENVRRIALYEDSLDSISWAECEELLGIWTQLPAEEQTPQGLWAAVDDHWRQKLVYIEDVGHTVTPKELFDWLQEHWTHQKRMGKALMKSLQNQVSETSKILTSQPGILIPKFDSGAAELVKRMNADLGIVSGGISQLGFTNSELMAAHLSSIKRIEEMDAWNNRLRDAAVGWQQSNLAAYSAMALASADSIIQMAADQAGLLRQAVLSANIALYEPSVILRQWEEIGRRYRKALQILEVDPDNPNEYYRDAPLDALEQEAAIVSWMKGMAWHGRLKTPEATKQLLKFASSGQISEYTLDKFMFLVTDAPSESMANAEFRVPPTNEFELQIQLDSALPPQRLIYPVAPGQTPVVRVLTPGASNQLWQPVQRQLWMPNGDSESPKQSPRRVKDKRSRLKCGLVQWRNQQGGKSIENICQETGIIAEKTFYNYKNEGLIYTDADLQNFGVDWDELWAAYQRAELEALIDRLLDMRTGS